MKAIVLHGYGPAENLTYEDVADPKPAAGEVLVRVAAVSINPIDWKLRSGSLKDMMPISFPHILGRDVAGTVKAVGEGVTGFAPGDRVLTLAAQTYAELCVVKAAELARIPEGMEFSLAAALPLVTMTGDQLIRFGTKVQAGQTVLVTGALGAVGRVAVFAAVAAGATVIAGVRGAKLAEAEALPGVSRAIAIDDDAAIERLDQVDGIADTVGGAAAGKLVGKVKPGSNFGSVVGSVPERPGVNVNRVFARADAGSIARYAEVVRAAKLEIPIDRVIPLADAAAGQEAAERGGVAKIVLAV